MFGLRRLPCQCQLLVCGRALAQPVYEYDPRVLAPPLYNYGPPVMAQPDYNPLVLAQPDCDPLVLAQSDNDPPVHRTKLPSNSSAQRCRPQAEFDARIALSLIHI